MAYCEQHGNREAKKRKKNKPHSEAQPGKWVIGEVVEAKATAKH